MTEIATTIFSSISGSGITPFNPSSGSGVIDSGLNNILGQIGGGSVLGQNTQPSNLGTLIGAGGSLLQGLSGAAASSTNAAIGRINAQEAVRQTSESIEDRTREIARTLGAARAAAGQSGLSVSGSFEDTFTDSVVSGERDIIRLGIAGSNRAKSLLLQSEFDSRSAVSQGVAGLLSAGTKLLGGV